MNRNEKPLYNEEQLHSLQNNSRHRREERNESIRGWFKSILWLGACALALTGILGCFVMSLLYLYNLIYGVQNELLTPFVENCWKYLVGAFVGILSKDKLKDVLNKN